MRAIRESTYRFATGALAGLLATAPMTVWMLVGQRALSWWSQDELPPAKITHRALRAVGWHHNLSRNQKAGLVAMNHFAYGAGAGAVYASFTGPSSAPVAMAAGAAYGLAVWTGGYCGWLPASGLYPPPTEDSVERTGLMIGAHLIWGSTTGLVVYWLTRRRAELVDYSPEDGRHSKEEVKSRDFSTRTESG